MSADSLVWGILGLLTIALITYLFIALLKPGRW